MNKRRLTIIALILSLFLLGNDCAGSGTFTRTDCYFDDQGEIHCTTINR